MARKHYRKKTNPNPSVMNHDFSMIPSVNIQRSVFNRSSGYKTTFDSGYLVPFFVDEALPGDTFRMKVSMLARLATPIVPVMDNAKLDFFFFSVPYRLIWENWQRFNGEQDNPGDSTDYLIPQMKSGSGFATGSMADYFGLPTGVSNLSVSSLPFRAYNLIYNEWFRDQNMINSVPVPKGDADDTIDNFPLRKRGKRHDYFTSCLPWPQKGDGVELSLGTPTLSVAEGSPLYLSATRFAGSSGSDPSDFQFVPTIKGDQRAWIDDGTGGHISDYNPIMAMYGNTGTSLSVPFSPTSEYTLGLGENFADAFTLTSPENLTINSLRQAFQLQRLLERDARGGTRYTELIRSHFGVISPDSRVQRPEFLGSGSIDINLNPVAQNSSTSTTPQGNLAAYGIANGVRNGFNHSFVEHCFVIGICCVRADLTYQQGVPRMFSRKTRFDHYWPTLAHLGEQAVLNKEIYAQGTDEDDEVFGYQERFAEYRYRPSQITGKMRSTDPQSLDVWHWSQKFNNLPKLNQEFIEENPPIKRSLAVQNEPEFIVDMYFDLKCARPMPTYSIPGYIDHF